MLAKQVVDVRAVVQRMHLVHAHTTEPARVRFERVENSPPRGDWGGSHRSTHWLNAAA